MTRIIRILAIVMLASELVLRFFGLGLPVLFVHSEAYEYMYAPSQDVQRFGNRILTNEYSMRSLALNKGEVRVLKIGDSVINGGTHTDHDSLATTLLENKLAAELDPRCRVLNISAGSWGPDNVMAYLNEHGHFDAKAIFFVFSSHDWDDNMTHKHVVGVRKHMPEENPPMAVYEVLDRYVLPKLLATYDPYVKLGIDQGYSGQNTGWNDLFAYAEEHGLKVHGYIHPTQSEAEAGEYSEKGQQIIAFCKSNNVPLILGVRYMQSSCYRDDLHLNDEGQRRLSEIVYPTMKSWMQELLR